MNRLAIALVGLTVAIPADLAFAQADQVPPKVREACEADYKKFCLTTIPGGGRVLACMRSNLAQLTAACRTALNEVKDAAPPK